RKALDPVQPARPQPLRVPALAYRRHRVGDRVENQVDLQPRQVGTDAVVRAGTAEPEVRVRIAANVEQFWMIEHCLVEIGRPVEQAEPIAGLYWLAPDCRVGLGSPLERGDGRRPPDDLVRSRRWPLGAVALPLVQMVEEREHAV